MLRCTLRRTPTRASSMRLRRRCMTRRTSRAWLRSAAAAVGVTITVAAGDDGSTDGGTGNNVDFPASSPHVLACGGTKLAGSGTKITSEVVWNELSANEGATGGGVSNVFPLPSWQANAKVP